MNNEHLTKVTNGVVCPSCHSILADGAKSCPHCRLELDWLKEDSLARKQLERWLERCTPELLISARWADGEAQARRIGPGELELVTGPLGKLAFVWKSVESPVVLDSGDGRAEFTSAERRLLGSVAVTVQVNARLPVEPTAPRIEGIAEGLSLKHALRPVVIGRRLQENILNVDRLKSPHPDVEMDHCLVVRQEFEAATRSGGQSTANATRIYWLIDQCSSSGTFVNHEPILARRLEGGDLLQIGPYAWSFDGVNERLVPVGRISGTSVALRQVAGGVLQRLDLAFAPGELVAIQGPSGIGKSTLLKMLIDAPGARRAGRILVDGRDIDFNVEWFRDVLGYVPQSEAVHGELTARQAVSFAARLRDGAEPTSRDLSNRVNRILEQVELDDAICGQPIRSLSGGQRQRLRVAVELVREPRLLILDEPTTGLNFALEQGLFRLLKSLSLRGCTVVVVTHSISHLEMFDRIVALRRPSSGGAPEIAYSGPATALFALIPSGRWEDIDFVDFNQSAGKSSTCATTPGTWKNDTSLNLPGPPAIVRMRHQSAKRIRGYFTQFAILVEREWRLTTATAQNTKSISLHCQNGPDSNLIGSGKSGRGRLSEAMQSALELTRRTWVKCIIVPAGLAPSLFAVAIGVSASAQMEPRWGFLAILATIWMGSSLSLMSIVAERGVFDHERLSFLRIVPYLGAKLVALSGLAFVQTTVFVGLLLAIRSEVDDWSDNPILRELGAAGRGKLVTGYFLVLLASSLVAVSLGLLISALVKNNKQLANYLLPLMMIAQMVFSVQVAMGSDAGLGEAYGTFHPWNCQQPGCLNHANRWLVKEDDSGKPIQTGWRCNQDTCGQGTSSRSDTLVAAIASYAVISRYADILLRSFAYYPHDLSPAESSATAREHAQQDYVRWRIEAVAALFLMTMAFVTSTVGILWWQSSNVGYRLWQHLKAPLLASTSTQSDGGGRITAA